MDFINYNIIQITLPYPMMRIKNYLTLSKKYKSYDIDVYAKVERINNMQYTLPIYEPFCMWEL